MKFKIQGKFDEEDHKPLYWSNKLGWVDFNSATVFEARELIGINLPDGAECIAWLNQNGIIDYAVEIHYEYQE
jgi:hypothetical protein